jgi:8-oxo-dGTP diphosphatase
LVAVHTERPNPAVIVGAAILADGLVLACERATPPESAGRWEFPGGKVEPGESDHDALVRECAEELGVLVEIGDRVGADVPLAHGRAVLRVWLARLTDGEPVALEHASLRWLRFDELDSVAWLPADAPIVAELAVRMAAGAGVRDGVRGRTPRGSRAPQDRPSDAGT